MNRVMKFCVFAVMITLVQRSVKTIPLISLQIHDEDSDRNHDRYVMFDSLQTSLVNSAFNIYQLQSTFYTEELVLCFPVIYEIECSTEVNETWNINCTSGYTMPFLWTYFDTETFAGRVLLFFTKNHLTSPFFKIRHKFCHFSPDTDGITLYLQVNSFPILRGNVSVESLISTTLLDITRKLKDYASSDGKSPAIDTAGGHSLKWDPNEESEFGNDTWMSGIIIPTTLITVAFLVGFNGGLQLLIYVRDKVAERRSYYYIFWSFECLAALINGIYTWVIPIIEIKLAVPLFALIYAIVVIICYGIGMEVPFQVCCFEVILCCTWKRFMGILATCNIFIFFVYMVYTLPWIVIGFYLYPIKILVTLGATLAAALCFLANFFVILYYSEECIKNCIICKKTTGTFGSVLKKCGKTCKKNCSCKRNQYVNLDNANEDEDEKLSCCWSIDTSKCWDMFTAASKCITGILVLICLGCIVYLLQHIISVFTDEVREAVIEILHILPLIVISLAAYFLRNMIILNRRDQA